MSLWQPRLHVHIAWHPTADPALGEELACAIQRCIGHDVDQPFRRAINIPVFFHSTPAKGQETPVLEWDQAEQTVIIVLIEARLLRDRAWQAHIHALYDEAKGHDRRYLLPIGLIEGAHNLLGAQADALTGYAQVEDPQQRKERVVRMVVQELCRHLGERPATPGASPRPLQLFISHTKRDAQGEHLATLFKQVVDENPLGRFFDRVSIAAGYSLSEEILRSLGEMAMVMIRTDSYGDSPWCQLEVLEAKRLRRPMVILDALSERESRLLPGMANVPATRLNWSDELSDDTIKQRMQANLDRVLEEVLGYIYALERLQHLQQQGHLPPDARIIARPPEDGDILDELLRLTQAGEAGSAVDLIYPEPPLAEVECRLLNQAPSVRPATPLTRHKNGLAGLVLGLSISGGDEQERQTAPTAAGMTTRHLGAALFEFSRHAVAHGAVVAYGGDLRPGGFTDNLFEYLHARKAAGLEQFQPAINYLAWPLHLNADDQWFTRNMDVAELRKLDPPEDLLEQGLDPAAFSPPTDPASRYIRARCLTRMRQEMAADLHARVLVCGKVTGYSGRYPGILEEALLALEKGIPLYPLGGFGGITQSIVQALLGEEPHELTEAFQRRDANYAGMLDDYQEQREKSPDRIEPVDYRAVMARLQERGVAGLNNGLSEEENRVLLATRDMEQAMGLVFDGLRRRPNNLVSCPGSNPIHPASF